ncbi:MAG: hypothetical protein U9O96_05995 [Candidatus Thermoplasmatota archaeon]|nr:hypothetical protein [Candidatus Thermoplasmatota archaeon]
MKKFVLIMISILVLASLINVNGIATGVGVEIVEPEDGTVFHQRNVSIRCVASACCGDTLAEYGWTWRWDNGSYSESSPINDKTNFSFYINISLYPGWNKVDVYVASTSLGVKGFDNITLYYDGPLANANGPYKGRAGKIINFHGSAYGGHRPYQWHWDFGDGEQQ